MKQTWNHEDVIVVTVVQTPLLNQHPALVDAMLLNDYQHRYDFGIDG